MIDPTPPIEPTIREPNLNSAPPIWWAFRDEEPNRPISYAVVTINGKRVGRIDKPDVMSLDEQMLLERYPGLYEHGHHEVRLDFRSQRGRGALGQVNITFGAMDGEGETDDRRGHQNPEVTLIQLAERVMHQNERLVTKMTDQVHQNAEQTMGTHERMIAMLTQSMERDRLRHSEWLEREGQLRASVTEANAARAQNSGDAQARMMEMILPLIASGGGGGQFMEQIQGAVTEKLMGGILEKIEGMGEGGGDPMAQAMQVFGPMIMEKLGGGGAPPTAE